MKFFSISKQFTIWHQSFHSSFKRTYLYMFQYSTVRLKLKNFCNLCGTSYAIKENHSSTIRQVSHALFPFYFSNWSIDVIVMGIIVTLNNKVHYWFIHLLRSEMGGSPWVFSPLRQSTGWVRQGQSKGMEYRLLRHWNTYMVGTRGCTRYNTNSFVCIQLNCGNNVNFTIISFWIIRVHQN